MTTKEAATKFKLTENEVRKRKNDGMILGAWKDKGKIVIPDETKIIPSKKEIQGFLFQILLYKNNPGVIISRALCPDETRLSIVCDYLRTQGFIGDFSFYESIEDTFDSIRITNDGLSFVFGNKTFSKLQTSCRIPIALNPTFNFSLVHIGI